MIGEPARACVIDPPWEQGDINGRPLPYPTLTLDEIRDLDVGRVVAREGYVWCWTTNRFLGDAFLCLSSWGFTYRQTIVWRKRGRCALGGMFATDVEFCLIGQKIGPASHARTKNTRGRRQTTSVFDWPVGEHSEKPGEFFALVEEMISGPYLEIFARRSRPGWRAIGDAMDGSDARVVLARPQLRFAC